MNVFWMYYDKVVSLTGRNNCKVDRLIVHYAYIEKTTEVVSTNLLTYFYVTA